MREKISILCPSRGRPDLFRRMVESARTKGTDSHEILGYVDDDDPTVRRYSLDDVNELVVGIPGSIGRSWNILAKKATGNFFMMGNDDLVFLTEDWDEMIIEYLMKESFQDGIFVAWVDDGASGSNVRCAFPIISRRWYDVLGYFVPECFHFLWHDTWIADIGRRLNRLLYIRDVVIEHRHFTFHKAEYDRTYKLHRTGSESTRKRREDQSLFGRLDHVRELEARRLKSFMK